jgi:hypothetical protein
MLSHFREILSAHNGYDEEAASCDRYMNPRPCLQSESGGSLDAD